MMISEDEDESLAPFLKTEVLSEVSNQCDEEDMVDLGRNCPVEFKEYYVQMQAAKRSQAPVPSQEVVEIKRTDKTGNERVVGSVITARDRWLKPGGVILPSNATLYIAPITHVDRYSESIDFWQNVYGIDSFIAMHATLASRNVDCCLIPDSPLFLEGRGGLFEFIEERLRKWTYGYCDC